MQFVLIIAILSLLLWTLLPQSNRAVEEDLSLEEITPSGPSRTNMPGH